MSVVKSKRSKPKLGVLTKAHAKQGNTHNLILSMDRFYENLWEGGKSYV